jgi:AcrR family transcriptional regulator
MEVNPPAAGGASDAGARANRPRRSQAERSAATRDALLTAARQAFAEKGYAGTGRELVADMAGVTRGALYHHFGSKPAMFRAVVEAVEAETCERIAVAAMSAGGGALEALRRGCQAFLDSALETDMRQIVLIDGPAVLGWSVWREIDARYGYALLREGIAHVLAEQAGSPASDAQIDTIAHLLLGALNEAAMLVANAGDPLTARAEVGATVDGLLGLLTTQRLRSG